MCFFVDNLSGEGEERKKTEQKQKVFRAIARTPNKSQQLPMDVTLVTSTLLVSDSWIE